MWSDPQKNSIKYSSFEFVIHNKVGVITEVILCPSPKYPSLFLPKTNVSNLFEFGIDEIANVWPIPQ